MNTLLQKAEIAGFIKVTFFQQMMQKIYQNIIIFHLTSHRWTFLYGHFDNT